MAEDPLAFVAFDIETTGFDAEAEVTVVGFARELGCRIFCRTDGGVTGTPGQDGDAAESRARDTETAETLESRLRERVDTPIAVSTHDGESPLLAAVTQFVRANLDGDDELLVAYNGERYRGGFDLPFLRTRYAAQDMPWPFGDLPYADLLPVVRDQFNTTVDGDTHDDLTGAYGVLLGEGLNDLDPFADSAAAVGAYERGDTEALVLHNVADVLRTFALGQLSRRYCSRSDYQLKSLTPADPES